MFKRYSVHVHFKSGASVETYQRAHNLGDAIAATLPLFNQTDTLISVTAREVVSTGAPVSVRPQQLQEPPPIPAAQAAAQVAQPKKRKRPGPKPRNGQPKPPPQYSTPDGQATDHT